jgi:RIO kinase 1
VADFSDTKTRKAGGRYPYSLAEYCRITATIAYLAIKDLRQKLMKTPKRIEPLIEDGLVDEVLRPLMSGKEAAVYVVRCGNELRCAKVYKEANKRSFRQAAEYQEGRKVRNSRQARAMAKGSKFGRKETEDAWQNAEVAALFRLASAGVRVPKPYDFLDGVLLMELVADEYGDAAPRLNDVVLEPDQAREYHAFLIEQIVLMLCAGLVHGDLSEFNVLLAPSGPVIIDLPQAVDAAGNNHAFSMLERDVGNMAAYFGRFAPELRATRYAKEMWAYYQAGTLSPSTVLTGEFDDPEEEADVGGVLREIEAARLDEARRQAARAADDAPPGRTTEEPPPPWMQ